MIQAEPEPSSGEENTIQIDTCHFEIHVHSFEDARKFYVDQLGFTVLQIIPAIGLLSVSAGAVRISIFADGIREQIAAAATSGGGHIIFRTTDLVATIEELRAAGLEPGAASEAPGFMRYVTLDDPSGNRIDIAEYLRDPLAAI